MRKFVLQLVALGFIALPAFATGIQYVCDSSIASGVCTTLNTTIAGQYASVFTNTNAVIYIQMAAAGNDVGSNEQFYNTVSYSTYYNELSNSISGANDVTAINSLGGGTTNPVDSSDGVALTSALDAALGHASDGIGICTTATNSSCGKVTHDNPKGVPVCFGISSALNCYNDVITISNSLSLYYDTGPFPGNEYDFFTTVEHETDEALGTSSCLGNSGSTPVLSPGCTNGGSGVSAADLFRYASPGTRSFLTTADGTPAYFSITSGAHDIADYHNSPDGADYGDFSSTCTYVQDAFGCTSKSNFNITNDGGVEIAMLDAVGYTLTAQGQLETGGAPEPATITLFTLGLGVIALGRLKSTRRKSQ